MPHMNRKLIAFSICLAFSLTQITLPCSRTAFAALPDNETLRPSSAANSGTAKEMQVAIWLQKIIAEDVWKKANIGVSQTVAFVIEEIAKGREIVNITVRDWSIDPYPPESKKKYEH